MYVKTEFVELLQTDLLLPWQRADGSETWRLQGTPLDLEQQHRRIPHGQSSLSLGLIWSSIISFNKTQNKCNHHNKKAYTFYFLISPVLFNSFFSLSHFFPLFLFLSLIPFLLFPPFSLTPYILLFKFHISMFIIIVCISYN